MAWEVRAEVERVVADLVHWWRMGVTVVAVEPLDGEGVRVGVQGLHPLVARAMRARYRFPVECWDAPTVGPPVDPEVRHAADDRVVRALAAERRVRCRR